MATEDLGATEGQPISVVIPFCVPGVLFRLIYPQTSRSYYLFFTIWGLSSNGTGMYAKGVDRYFPEMRLRRIQE